MGYNKQLNDSYRIVYTDTGSTALPEIHTFDHTGVYSLIAKPSQLGKTVTIGFSVVSGGKTSNTTLAEGNYFVEYSELASNIYWNFSFLGKANSGSDFTAQNTMVTYDKSKGTYTVKTDELSGGGGVDEWVDESLTFTPYAVVGTPSGTAFTINVKTDGHIFYGTGKAIFNTKSSTTGDTTVRFSHTYKCNKQVKAICFPAGCSVYPNTDGSGSALASVIMPLAFGDFSSALGANMGFAVTSSSANATSAKSVSGTIYLTGSFV